MEAALVAMLDRIMSGSYDPVSEIVSAESLRGFFIIRPAQAVWFLASDWKPTSVASITPRGIARLVLIDAVQPGTGALTRTLAAIQAAGLKPAVIDPNERLAKTLARRGWRGRLRGAAFEDRETIWTPRHAN